MDSQEISTKILCPYKEDVVQYVDALLTRLDQSGISLSITITQPETLEDYYVIDVTMSSLGESYGMM